MYILYTLSHSNIDMCVSIGACNVKLPHIIEKQQRFDVVAVFLRSDHTVTLRDAVQTPTFSEDL